MLRNEDQKIGGVDNFVVGLTSKVRKIAPLKLEYPHRPQLRTRTKKLRRREKREADHVQEDSL